MGRLLITACNNGVFINLYFVYRLNAHWFRKLIRPRKPVRPGLWTVCEVFTN